MLPMSRGMAPRDWLASMTSAAPTCACTLAYADQIDDGAIRPVTAGSADDGGAGVDRAEDCIRPAGLRISLDGDDSCVVLSSSFAPGEDDRREVLGEKHDGAARADYDIRGGDGHAIADGGNDGDGVGTGTEDFAGERAKLLGGGKPAPPVSVQGMLLMRTASRPAAVTDFSCGDM